METLSPEQTTYLLDSGENLYDHDDLYWDILDKIMIATVEEMDAAQVPLRHRGYCAHLYIDWRKCMQHHYWMPSKCKGLESRYDHCEHDDFILRMKEYERERRLLVRQKRINEKRLKEEVGA